jgi:NAD(P)H dehydrogenase (quinone)
LKVFIVHAHPEPRSFNGALTVTAQETLEGEGHEVRISDLYAMRWDPVSSRENFTIVKDPDYYRQQVEELNASELDGFVPAIQNEMDKLVWCDALILRFPLWWFGMPAILKGWVDRVFAMGVVYGGGAWYDHGVFAGKRALLSITTGGPEALYAKDGLNGDIHQILDPVNRGILRFVGFDVLPPYIAYAPAHADDGMRRAYLQEWRERLLSIETTKPIKYTPLEQYDDTFRLKSKAKGGG